MCNLRILSERAGFLGHFALRGSEKGLESRWEVLAGCAY